MHNRNLIIIILKSQQQNQKTLYIYNVYNASLSQRLEIHSRINKIKIETMKKYSKISFLDTLRIAIAKNEIDKHLIIKNFNLHHFLWINSKKYQHSKTKALINLINDIQLQLLISKNISIFKQKKRNEIIIINLTLIIINIANIIIKCDIIKKLNYDFDYKALLTKLNRIIEFHFLRENRNWKKMNKIKFLKRFNEMLSININFINNIKILNNHVNRLIITLFKTIKKITSINKICFKFKSFMNLEYRTIIKHMRKLKRKW